MAKRISKIVYPTIDNDPDKPGLQEKSISIWECEVLQDIKGMVNNISYDLKKGQIVNLDDTAIWIFKDKVKVTE